MKIKKIEAYHIILEPSPLTFRYQNIEYIRVDPKRWYMINDKHLNLIPNYEIEEIEETFMQTNNVMHEQLELI